MLRAFTLLALSACTVVSASASGTNRDLRPTHAKDQRVVVTLVNKSFTFRDVTVDGHRYTLMPNELLTVKGPVGTVVYAASAYGKTHRGDPLVGLEPQLDKSRVTLN
jgi:hypothetical protein